MIEGFLGEIMGAVASVDPGPFFAFSIFPYLLFLYWIQKSKTIPKISTLGFKMTLLFVAMTIVFAILAQHFYGSELTDVDPLHGAAEAFLCISDALIVLGFMPSQMKKEMKNS